MSNKIQKQVKITNPTYLYQRNREHEQYLSKMTNCDEIITEIINKQGYITPEERQQIRDSAETERSTLLYKEHIKVVEFAEKTSTSLKKAMKLAGVGTVTGLYKFIEEANKARASK